MQSTVSGFFDALTGKLLQPGSVVALTGDVDGLHFSRALEGYDSVEAVLAAELAADWHILSLDINRIDFLTDGDMSRYAKSHREAPRDETGGRIASMLRRLNSELQPSVEDLVRRATQSDYLPLHNLSLLRTLTEIRSDGEEKPDKPLLILIRDSAVMFPEKAAAELQLDQAQRLQAFLNWVRSKEFSDSPHLIALINPTLSDLNSKIRQLKSFARFEMPLPGDSERLRFLNWHAQRHAGVDTKLDAGQLAKLTSGMSLSAIRSILAAASAHKRELTAADIASAVNRELQSKLGEIATFESPRHGPESVIGYDGVKTALSEIFEDCADPQTAHSMVLLVGPNGGGKTFIFQGMAQASGRVILRLSKIRDSLYGNTEKFWEQFRFVASCYDNLCVVMDEADTQLGNVNSQQSHQVDNRLTGAILDVSSDAAFRGRLVWVLLTARPNNLSSDIISRCASATVPVFDLDGEPRQQFVKALFARSGIELGEELAAVMEKTNNFSNRDYDSLIRRVAARRKRRPEASALSVLASWAPGESIVLRRRYQELLAAEQSSFPELVPERIRAMSADEREKLKSLMEMSF